MPQLDHYGNSYAIYFNPFMMEIMWLRMGHLLQQVDISDIPVLSSAVRVVESVHGVILDSQLSLSSDIAALCRSGFCQLRQIQPSYLVTHVSSGLVQLVPVWCAGEPAVKVAVTAECCRSSTHQCTQMYPHHSSAASYTGCQTRDVWNST